MLGPSPLTLTASSVLVGLSGSLFESFLRVADTNNVPMNDVMDVVMAHIPAKLASQIQGHAGLRREIPRWTDVLLDACCDGPSVRAHLPAWAEATGTMG